MSFLLLWQEYARERGYGRRWICAVIDGRTLEDFIIFYMDSSLYSLDTVVIDGVSKSELPHSFQSRVIEAVLLLHCV